MNLTDKAFSGLPKGNNTLNPDLESWKPRTSDIPGISYDTATRGMQKILAKLLNIFPTNK